LLDSSKPGIYKYSGLDFQFDYEPFYIGKGKGKRLFVHELDVLTGKEKNVLKRNRIQNIISSGKFVISCFLTENLSCKRALKLEVRFIKQIGRIITGDGPLTNLTEGGEGFDSETCSRICKRSLENGTHPFLSDKIRKMTSDRMLEKVSKNKHPFQDPAIRKLTTESTKDILTERNKRQLEDGTHIFLNKEFRDKDLERFRNGTHALQRPQTKEACRVSREDALAKGIHAFQNPVNITNTIKRTIQRNKEELENGKHPFQRADFYSKRKEKNDLKLKQKYEHMMPYVNTIKQWLKEGWTLNAICDKITKMKISPLKWYHQKLKRFLDSITMLNA